MVQTTERGLEIFDEVHGEAQGIAEDLVAHLKPGEADQIQQHLGLTSPGARYSTRSAAMP
jgi:hypothetical protein